MLKVSFFNFCAVGYQDTPIVSKFLRETDVDKLAGIISLKDQQCWMLLLYR